ncbi:MAG TPA: hypothetical protein VEK34_13090 [Methylocella sp.]|nr:hypothetical protein [Methylocella sp.]
MAVAEGSGQLNDGLAPVKPERLVGDMPNKPHQAPNWLFPFPNYRLVIVEFDDQGCCYDRRQILGFSNFISEMVEAASDAILIAFVHGWKHDARSNDENLTHFRSVLDLAAFYENEQAARLGEAPRPVVGVFAAWRGLSLYDNIVHLLANITFWDRQDAGRRVSTGSVRELLGYVHAYREGRGKRGGRPLVVIAGHSFGGMITYSALAQSLIEAAATPSARVVPSFADLVLLINPAIEGARYLPVQVLIEEREAAGDAVTQPPVFVSATAKNDWATRIAFPLGNVLSLLTERWTNKRERQAMLHTIGHIPWMLTHTLSADPSEGPTGYKLTPLAPDKASKTPFWVVQATPEVIDGHSGIFKPRFLAFVADLVFAHADHTALRVESPQIRDRAHAACEELRGQ